VRRLCGSLRLCVKKYLYPMHQKLFITEDGSHSIQIPELNVSYHSKHGAIQESQHIYIETGLKHVSEKQKKISVLEVGFGTGLNALLTLIEAEKNDLQILYDVVELYPLDSVFVASLNYLSLLQSPQLLKEFSLMHACEWNTAVKISGHFELKKVSGDIRYAELAGSYDLVYFDAFDPAAQPYLWTADVFRKIHTVMNKRGILVTFCSKGEVRRALEDAGFSVFKLAGPKGKREIVRAIKI